MDSHRGIEAGGGRDGSGGGNRDGGSVRDRACGSDGDGMAGRSHGAKQARASSLGCHCVGGGAVAMLGDRLGLLVRMPMSAGGTTASPSLVSTLASDGCGAKQIDPAVGTTLVEFASSAVLEETLMCSTGTTAELSASQQKYPQVGEYREDNGPE